MCSLTLVSAMHTPQVESPGQLQYQASMTRSEPRAVYCDHKRQHQKIGGKNLNAANCVTVIRFQFTTFIARFHPVECEVVYRFWELVALKTPIHCSKLLWAFFGFAPTFLGLTLTIILASQDRVLGRAFQLNHSTHLKLAFLMLVIWLCWNTFPTLR